MKSSQFHGFSSDKRKVVISYLQQIMRTCALLWVHLECKVQEIAENRGQVVLLLDRWSAVGRDQIERAQWRFGQVGWLALDHLDRHDSQAPDVDFAAVFLACDDFRCHPVRRANHGSALHVRFVDLCAEAKIGEFDVAFHAEQNIVGLDVTVNDALGVQELETM